MIRFPLLSKSAASAAPSQGWRRLLHRKNKSRPDGGILITNAYSYYLISIVLLKMETFIKY